MIVCSCNVITDSEIRAALNGTEGAPRWASQIYDCLGCSSQCGRCVRNIQGIMDETLRASVDAGADPP
jgi:bacterioferritin-associated ferredoxin